MKLKITVHGVAYEVEVEVLDAGDGFPVTAAGPLPKISSMPQGQPVSKVVPPSAAPKPAQAPLASSPGNFTDSRKCS